MTHLKIYLNGSENVSSNIILKLYDIALNDTLDNSSDLYGTLYTLYAYRYQVDYLTSTFSDLHINVTGDWLVDFGDEEMPKALAQCLGYSNNFITETLANSIAMFDYEAIGNNYWFYNSNLSSESPGLFDNNKIRYLNLLPLTRLKSMVTARRIHCASLEKMNTGHLVCLGGLNSSFECYERSVFANGNIENACLHVHTLVCPYLLIFGASAIYGCDSMVDVYAPRCKWVGKYQTRDNNNWSLFYLEDVIAFPANFFDDINDNYTEFNIVINRVCTDASDLPILYSSASVEHPTVPNYTELYNISGEGGFESATLTTASSSDINDGALRWGHAKIYVPDECVNLYKQTSPYTKLADKIFGISDLSQTYKNMIYANVGVQL